MMFLRGSSCPSWFTGDLKKQSQFIRAEYCVLRAARTKLKKIDIGMPSRAFPVTPPGIRVRTTAVRLVKLFAIRPIERGLKNQSEHLERHSSEQDCGSDATGREHCLRLWLPGLYECPASSVPQIASCHASNVASRHNASDAVSNNQAPVIPSGSGCSRNSLASQSSND